MAFKKIAEKVVKATKKAKEVNNKEEVKRTIIDLDHVLVEYSDGSTESRVI
jgi:hypothetical protein